MKVLTKELRKDVDFVYKADVMHRKSKSKKQVVSGQKAGEPSVKEGLDASVPESLDSLNESPSEKSPRLAEDESPTKSSKKSKKRKHMAVDPERGTQTANSTKSEHAPSMEEPPKKRHKNRTEFADPRIDTTLNTQSRKALEYAFLQMNRPSKWKFNKARQNWLIRNIWNPEAVSDVYIPFVLKYLANLQGGSREKLKETCEVYLKPVEAPKPTEESAQGMHTPTSIHKSILKKTTTPKAGPLIDGFPVPGPLISSSPSTAVPGNLSPSHTHKDIQKKRAQFLLDALGSGSSTNSSTIHLHS